MHLPAISSRRHSVFGLSVCLHAGIIILKGCEHYLTHRLWESHQIYNLGAVGNKDELIRM